MSWSISKPILVPIDFSGMSVEAIATACKISQQNDNVVAVHVVSNYDQITPGMERLKDATDEERRANVQSHFSSYLKEHGFGDIRELVLEGQPEVEIPRYATQIDAGLIVIPSHGYDGIKRLLLGSVAECVIREANCPVLVMRRKDAE